VCAIDDGAFFQAISGVPNCQFKNQELLMDLKTAMHSIRTDSTKGKQFLADPAGTLKTMGVDVTQHRITTTQQVPSGSTHGACASGGCGACVSVG
jgi:hypothetical protein